MSSAPAPPAKRAGFAFAAFLAMGVIVWAGVSLLSGDVTLGALYGLAPGVVLGVLAVIRLRRGGLIRREHRPDSRDHGRA